MPQFSLAGLTEQSTEIKALKRELEKGTGQSIVSIELDRKLKKIDDVATRGVSLFFEQGQSLYIVFRKNGDQIQIQQNGKKIPFSGMLNYSVDVKLFNLSVKELAGYIREYQLKFDKLQERKKLKQIDESIAKTERQRKVAVTTQIKQLTELSANLDSEIATMTEQNALLESEVLQLEQQKQEPMPDTGESIIQDEPVVLSGNEFGYNENMPIDELREKAIAHLESIRKNIKFVDVPALKVKEENTQVEIRERGIKHIKTFSPNPEKLLILAQIEKLLKTSKYLYTWDNAKTTKKPTVQLYHYLTNTFEWKGEKLTCVIVIEKDNKGLLHYDVLMNKYAQKHLDKAKEMVENLTSKKNPRNSQPSNEYNNQLDGLSQDDFDDDMILDSAKSSNSVLNLFIFNKDGYLIDDKYFDDVAYLNDVLSGKEHPNADESRFFDVLERIEQYDKDLVSKVMQKYNELNGKVVDEPTNVEPTQNNENTPQNQPLENTSNDDLSYLQDMADGNIELTVENMSEHINKIEQIAERLGDEHEDLIEKAVEKYTEFALSVKVG